MDNDKTVLRFKGAYNYNGERFESEPLLTSEAARAFCAEAPDGASRGTILREHDRGINDGKFFLHLILPKGGK